MHSAHPESQELFTPIFSNTSELFLYMKNLLNLFFLQLSPGCHKLVLLTITNLLQKVPIKQPKLFMASLFSYKEVFQKMLKDCTSLKLQSDKTISALSYTLNPETAKFSGFLELLLSLIRSRIKHFSTTEESHFNIYALYSLIASLSNVLNTPIDLQTAQFPYTFKTLESIIEIFKELIPKQEFIRDFNLVEVIKTRLELDLEFLARRDKNQPQRILVLKNNLWTEMPLQKLISFDCKLIRIIDSSFQPQENLNHHHGMSALARKILDSPFLGLLAEVQKTRITNTLALETLVLLGNLVQEAPNLLNKLLASDIILSLIDEYLLASKQWHHEENEPSLKGLPEKIKSKTLKEQQRMARLLPGLMNFVYSICMSPKGLELEKKHNLFAMTLKLQLSPRFIEAISRDVSSSKSNPMSLLAVEANKFTGNQPGYREVSFKAVGEVLETLIVRQEGFIKEIALFLTGKSPQKDPETFDYDLLVKSLNNFAEFFSRFLTMRFLEKSGKTLACPFIKLASFPLLSLLDSDAHTKAVNCLRHFAYNCKEIRGGPVVAIFEELNQELGKLEKRLGGDLELIRDLNSVINDEMAYLARNKGLRAILSERTEGLKYLESLELLGSITYIENLLDFAIYAQSVKTRNDLSVIYRGVAKLYRLIVNQLNREDRYFLNKLLEEPSEDPKKRIGKIIDVVKTANEANRLHFHENLKTFLTSCAAQKELASPVKPIFAETLAKLLENLPRELRVEDPKRLVLELSHSLNILTHFKEILRDLLLNPSTGGFFPVELTVKMFEEGVFTTFFRFWNVMFDTLSNPILDSLKGHAEYEILQELAINLLSLLQKIVNILVLVPNDLDCELSINEKSARGPTIKPFLNFIHLETMNSFAIALKPVPRFFTSGFAKGLGKSLQSLVETCFTKLRLTFTLKHQELVGKAAAAPNKARKRPMYGVYGTEEGFDSPEMQRLAEEAVRDLGNMGFSKEISELAIQSLEYPSVEAATEWILSHPEDVKRLEEECLQVRLKEEDEAKKQAIAEKKTSTQGLNKPSMNLLGKKLMGELSEKEYSDETLLILFSLVKYFLRTARVPELEKPVWEFVVGIMIPQKPVVQSIIALEVYRLLYEDLKEWVQVGLGSKLNLKLGLKKIQQKEETWGKDVEYQGLLGKDFFEIKSQERDFGEKLRRIEGTLGLLLKASVCVNREEFEARKKLFRHENSLELLKVLEVLIEGFLANIEKTDENVLKSLDSLLIKTMIFANETFSVTKEIKPEAVKNLIGLLLNLLGLATQFNRKFKSNLLTKTAVQGYLTLLLQTLQTGNHAMAKVFLEKKGLVELLKLEVGGEFKSDIDGSVLGLFSSILESLLVDSDTLDAHFECEIKRFFLEKSAKKQKIGLNEFLERFREYHQREEFIRVMRRICLVSMKKQQATATAPAEEEKEKEKEKDKEKASLEALTEPNKAKQLISLLENIHLKGEQAPKKAEQLAQKAPEKPGEPFFISLKQGVSFTHLGESNKGNMEIEHQETRTIDFQLKGLGLQAFQLIIENILLQFSGILDNKTPVSILNFAILIKALQILIRKYPILIPGLLKFNCSKVLRRNQSSFEGMAARLEMQTRKKKEVSVSFLKFLIQVLCYASFEKFHGFLLELCLDNYLLYEQKSNKDPAGYSQLVQQKVLKTIYFLLKQEIEGVKFLKTQESLHSTFCYTTLHMFLLKHQDFCRSSLKPEDPLVPNFLKLYGDAFKQISLETHQDSALTLLQTPLSILYQIYLTHFARSQDKTITEPISETRGQLVPSSTLLPETGFFDDWKLLYQAEHPSESLDMNPLRFTAPPRVPNEVALGDPNGRREDSDDLEDPDDDDLVENAMVRGYEREEPENEDTLPRDLEAEEAEFEDVDDEDEEGEAGGQRQEEEEEVGDDDDEVGQEENPEEEGRIAGEQLFMVEGRGSQENDAEVPDMLEETIIREENIGGMELEQEQVPDSDSESLDVIEEEKQQQKEHREPVPAALQSDLIVNRGLNTSLFQTILGFEGVFLDSELARKYQSLVKSFHSMLDTATKEKINRIGELSNVGIWSNGVFFQEWQGVFQKVQLKTEVSPLRQDNSGDRGRFGDLLSNPLDERAMLLERMIGMEEEEPGSRNPLRLLNMLMNEREERYRNYFTDMRSHLDVLRNVVGAGGMEEEVRRRAREEVGLIGEQNVGSQRREVNFGEIVNGFRDRVIQGFNDSIQVVEEEEKKEEEKIVLEENMEKELHENKEGQQQQPPMENIEKPPENIEKPQENIEIPQENIEKPLVIEENINNPQLEQNKEILQNPTIEDPSKLQQPPIQNLDKPAELVQNNPNPIEEEKQDIDIKPVAINFEDLGLPADFLSLHNIDQEYFNSLSEEMQMDIILQNLPKDPSESQPENPQNVNPEESKTNANAASASNQPQEEAKGPDMSLLNPDMLAFLSELPENLRNEVMEQELARAQALNNQPAQPEIDNATFLASLLPELREEVLLTASAEFLETLPPEIIAEAQTLRDRVNFRHAGRYMNREPAGGIPKKKEKKVEKPLKPRVLSATIKDKTILQRLNSLDERILENLLSFLYCEQSVFQKVSIGLIQTLLRSPVLEYKMFDSLLFVLQCERLPKMKTGREGFPYLELETKNGVVRNYEAVYQEVSLRSLYLMLKFANKASLSYFLVKDDKKGLESLAVLREKRGILLNEPQKRSSNLNEFLTLAGYSIFQRSFVHLDLFVGILYAITEKIRTFGKDLELQIEPEAIGDLCRILRVDFLDDNIMKKLSHIISVLCLEKKNLDCFIEQLKLIILTISEKMNEKFEKNLILLRENIGVEEALIMSQVEGGLEGEKKIFKIFKIIKELFEKALSLEKIKSIEVSPEKDKEKNKEKAEKDKEKLPLDLEKDKMTIEKDLEHELIKRKAVRDSFQTLIMNESLNNLWINVTEMMMIMNEKYPNSVNFLNPIIHKLISVLEGFFIIYSIMRDDYALTKQVDQMKKVPNISHLEQESESEIMLERTISTLRNSKITIDEMFALLCEKNKKILNMMIRQNPNLLNESMSIVVAKMPKILEFDIKKTHFRRELKRLKERERDRYAPQISNFSLFFDIFLFLLIK